LLLAQDIILYIIFQNIRQNISFQSPTSRVRVKYGNYWRHNGDLTPNNVWIKYLHSRLCHKIQFECKLEKIRKIYDSFIKFSISKIKTVIFHVLKQFGTSDEQVT